MGYKFEVLMWVKVCGNGYRDDYVYRGDSIIKAIMAMHKAKKHSGCVTLKWR